MNVCTMSTPAPSSSPDCLTKDPAAAAEDPATAVDASTENSGVIKSNNINSKGVAGRIDYDKWHRVAKDLEQQVEVEEEQEEKESKAKLGLDGKYARSESEAQERVKAKQVQHVKKTIDKYKQREDAVKHEFAALFGPVITDEEQEATTSAAATATDSKAKATTIRITRNDLEAGKRVVTICDTTGRSQSRQDTIVLTQDLSSLESHMKANALQQPKTYAEDSENAVVEPPPQQQQPRSVFGLIKVFVRNVHNCTIICKCKIISGTLEFVNCSNVNILFESTTTVATIQGDLSRDVTLEFRNAPSGKNTTDNADSNKRLYWGDDEDDDRIFHAGVVNMTIRRVVNDIVEAETVVDYITDGATAVGNATAAEMQFITSMMVNPNDSTELQFLTQQAVRSGQSTGKNARAMTPREVEKSNALREKVKERAINMAEGMIQIKDKEGNVIVAKKEEATKQEQEEGEDDVVEEVLTTEIKEIVDECLEHKAKGNEAFGAGEYGQAILLYSLALDKAAELPPTTDDNNNNTLFPLDVVYSNRAACFLKLGQHEKALLDADAARALNPNNTKALFRSGLSLHAMGQYMIALPILAAAHKLEPTNAQIKQALQFCEVRLEQERRKASQG